MICNGMPIIFMICNVSNIMSSIAGGQTSIIIDINSRYPRAYIHRHSLQTPATRPTGFRQQGPAEVHYLCEEIRTMLQTDSSNNDQTVVAASNYAHANGRQDYTIPKKKIYAELPHITADNHFSGENVMEYIGQRGFGITTTCRRDRFPPGLKEFLHHEKVASTDKRTRVARFEQPILAVKMVKSTNGIDKDYTRTLVSFQSTGATNFTGVNNLMSVSLYVQPKYRGTKKNKLAWATEQNEAREIYLNPYHGVDSMDHMIKNTGNRYITWKFWHSPYLHAISMAIVACYDMYKECCSGVLDESWKVADADMMSYGQFLLKLSEQMLNYDPKELKFPGDEKMRRNTQQPKRRRKGSKDLLVEEESFTDDGVTLANLIVARMLPRFCQTADQLQTHFEHIINVTNKNKCEACGEDTYWMCSLCRAPLCLLINRKWTGARCAFLFHKEEFFGLARRDYIIGMRGVKTKKEIEKELTSWKAPNAGVIERNARYINKLRAELAEQNKG
jgi:hypothetical protein